jgi:glycosyltransferase involved in cell wall biosynthesis
LSKYTEKSSSLPITVQHTNRPSTSIRVLISGALPPPMGGVGFYYQTLLNSSLAEQVNLNFVETSTHDRQLSESGKATLSNAIEAIKDCWRLTKAIYIFHPQIVHISTAIGLSFVKHSFCVIIARLFGCKVLIHPHCSLAVLYNERPNWWKIYFRQIILLTKGVIALSKEWLDLLKFIPERRVYYLPNALNTKFYESIAETHLSESREKKTCNVLYLGYLGKSKGSYELLTAAQGVRKLGFNLEFDLVGGALAVDELEQLHHIVNSANLEKFIRIHPLTLGEAKLVFLRNADIFVYPSHYEGMPMAVLEAMACALPVIATKVGGLNDLIQDGTNGILVEPAKPDQLISALTKLASSPQLRARIGKSGYQTVCEKYDVEQHVSQLVKIYTQVSADQSSG